MRILLIEPNYNLGRSYKAAFEKGDYEIDWQRTAAGAISSADDETPDIVILELQLAGHSGVEFLYEFCSYPDWRDIPIIVHSMVGEEQLVLQKTQLKRLGVVKYLYKPSTDLHQLIDVVNQIPVRK